MALWYQSPVPPVAIRWVLMRDPEGQYEPLALLCTDQHAEAVRMGVCEHNVTGLGALVIDTTDI